MEIKMKKYTRNAIFTELKEFDYLSKEDDFIEITEWYNGEGFDVTINSFGNFNFQLTWGQYKALRKLIKKLEKD